MRKEEHRKARRNALAVPLLVGSVIDGYDWLDAPFDGQSQ